MLQLFVLLFSRLPIGVRGCTNLLVPSGSTVDGSTIITYSADSPELFGAISHWPAANHGPKALREIYSWDEGEHLGAIPQPPHTYNVVGNTNEYQLTIGETTFAGLEMLSGTSGKAVCNEDYGCIDYGQLIWVTLQRAKTAREAIDVMDDLVQTYGYASEGESFEIADPGEVWLMELIGKGNISKGAVWVATKIPDGYVSSTANQARTTTFVRDDPDKVRFSPDVVDFARSIGVFDGADEDFDFTAAYDPLTFSGARYCEARVYALFLQVAAEEEHIEDYLDYAQGYNLTHRMPLYVKVGKKLSVNDTMWAMRNHYEGTWFDGRYDVGAQAWNSPMSLGEGLGWTATDPETGEDATYVNNRNIGQQYASWNIIANQRPEEKFSVMWFGVDDSTFSLHVPIYGATTRIPSAWDDGDCTGRTSCRDELGLKGTIRNFTTGAMHWVGNMVANYAYSRYADVAPVVKEKLVQLESESFARVEAMDKKLESALSKGGKGRWSLRRPSRDPVALATEFSYEAAEQAHQSWLDFYGELFMTFVDGYRTVPDPSNLASAVSKETPGWTNAWKERIVNETGSKYLEPGTGGTCVDNDGRIVPCTSAKLSSAAPHSHPTINKLSLKALGGGSRRAFALSQLGKRMPKYRSKGHPKEDADHMSAMQSSLQFKQEI